MSIKLFPDIEKSHAGFLKNQSAVLLLILLNTALLMNSENMLWENRPLFAITVMSALLTFFNPKWYWPAIINIICIGIFYGLRFPLQANHTNLEFFVFVLIAALLIAKKLFRLTPDKNMLSWFIRISVVSIYFYTGFHKLNYDFFNPCVSCVNRINQSTFQNLTSVATTLSPGVSRFFQISALFTELILPFGLLWKRTRIYSGIIFLIFHFYLCLTVFSDFSSFGAFMILASLTDFTKTPPVKIFTAIRVYVFFALSAITVYILLTHMHKPFNFNAHVSGFIFAIGYAYFYSIYIRNYRSTATYFDKKYLKILIIPVLLISFYSMKSYIGLGNSANLTMFSNLLTEKSRSNHFLIDTKKTKIFDFEEDNVLVLKLHPKLKSTEFEGFRIPLINFRYWSGHWISNYPQTALNCTLVYKNDTINIPDLRKAPFFSHSKWWYKYISFRKIQPEGPNECYW